MTVQDSPNVNGPMSPDLSAVGWAGDRRDMFRIVVENALDVITLWTTDNRLIYASPSIERVLGYTPDELAGVRGTDLLHPEDLNDQTLATISRIESTTGPVGTIEARYRTKDGSWRRLETVVNVALDPSGERRVICYSRDVTQQRELEHELEESEERYRLLVENSPDAVVVHRDGQLLYVNPACVELMGARDASDLIGRSMAEFVHPEYRETARSRALTAQRERRAMGKLEERLVRLDGRVVDVEVVTIPITYVGRPSVQTVIRDITERKLLEQQLNHLAYHDHLTGLPNRSLFALRLEQALVRAGNTGSHVAVLFVDLDGFKTANDSHGHSVGDRVLRVVGERMRSRLRSHDVLARFGGDEFCVLVEDVRCREDATHVAQRVMDALEAPIVIEDAEPVRVSASIGIAIGSPDTSGPAEELLREADAAMYRAKKKGKATFELTEIGSRGQLPRQ